MAFFCKKSIIFTLPRSLLFWWFHDAHCVGSTALLGPLLRLVANFRQKLGSLHPWDFSIRQASATMWIRRGVVWDSEDGNGWFSQCLPCSYDLRNKCLLPGRSEKWLVPLSPLAVEIIKVHFQFVIATSYFPVMFSTCQCYRPWNMMKIQISRFQNFYFCGIRCPGDVFVLSPPREFLPSTAMLAVVQAKTNSPDLSHKCLAIVNWCKLLDIGNWFSERTQIWFTSDL